MKYYIRIAFFIIILVCINWLNKGFAQYNEAQIQDLRKRFSDTQMQNNPTPILNKYHSPEIFDKDELMLHDSLLLGHREQKAQLPDSLSRSFNATLLQSDSMEYSQLVLPDRKKVEPFGKKLFRRSGVGEINRSAIPEGYILGPGDNLIISLWGRVQQEWNLTVDREGRIFIPKVGEITAWGMTLNQFKDILDTHLSRVYTGYERRVTLGKIRTIQVFVNGEVVNPGGYAISALSTLFDALYMSGGPNQRGSLRQIKLIRNNKSTKVDLYDFLINGNKECDLPLQSGDVVFVPLIGRQATIRGEVKRPAIYELTGNENISDLMALGGGPTADAYLGRIMLDRISDDDSRKIIDLDFSIEDESDMLLADGDDLSVFSIFQMRENIVWVTGSIKHPGTFERTKGMRVSDLIKMSQLLPNEVFMERANLYRKCFDGNTRIMAINLTNILSENPADDVELKDLDSLHIYSTLDVTRQKKVYVDGMVKNPGEYPLYDSMTLSDLIFMSGGFNDNAYLLRAELARVNEKGTTDVLEIGLQDGGDSNNFTLNSNDRLFIRKIPGYQIHRTVIVEGEVRFPGRYSLSHKDETLWELLNRAGGFTGKAFPPGAIFNRKAIADNLARKNIKSIIENSQPLIVDSTGMYKQAEITIFREENMGRIIIDMEQLVASGGIEGDLDLQAGDHIFIPETPSGVSVLGEACMNGTIKFKAGQNVKYYLNLAGGFTQRADKDHARLIKANGRVFASGSILGKKADLGDVIVIPAKIKKDRDWLKYITAGVSILTGVATSIFLIDRL